MKDYFGSCSGCGAWGEGGEPETLEDVLRNGELFDDPADALAFVISTYRHDYEPAPLDMLTLLMQEVITPRKVA
jgi:hypothetical protein